MLMTKRPEIVVIVDVDGCLCPYGVFLPTVRFFEEVSTAKSKLLKHSSCTSDCLTVGTQGWAQSVLSLPRALRADPTIRHYGRSVHGLVMKHVLQCKSNPELINAFNTLLNAQDVKIVFFTNGPRGHAQNVVKMVLGEALASQIPIVCSRELGNGERKPDKTAYESLVSHCKQSNIIGGISNSIVIDDSSENLRGAQAAFNNLNISVQCLRIGRSNPNDAFPSHRTLAEALDSINTNRAVCAPQHAASR
jgi:FMN phosphatase YigB (HAD superfamily)